MTSPRSTPRRWALLALGTALASLATIAPALAEALRLRDDVTVNAATIRLDQLIEGIGKRGEIPVFRAPAPGQSGTIRAERILEAARDLGIGAIETGDVTSVHVTRPARTIARDEMEKAVSDNAAERGIFGDLAIVLDEHLTARLVDIHRAAPLQVTQFQRNARTGRFDARLVLPGSEGQNDSWTVTGSIVETRDIAVPTRDLDRNEAISAKDITIIKRPLSQVGSDIVRNTDDLVGMLTRRAMRAGEFVRQADIAKPVLVEKQAIVTVVYAGRGLTLSMRGRALNAATQGETVKVQNPQSKKIIEGLATGPGQVTISAPVPAALPASLAAATLPRGQNTASQ